MAKHPAPVPHMDPTANAGEKSGKPFDLRKLFWAGVIIGLFMVISLPTVILIFVGMLPTLVAWMIDRTEQKYATFCVGGMNFAGVFPYLTDIWFKNHTTDMAINILADVFSLTVMYGAAGFGWVLYLQVPPIITSVLTAMSERRVTVLRTKQETIVEEWGENVAALVDPDEYLAAKAEGKGAAKALADAQAQAQVQAQAQAQGEGQAPDGTAPIEIQ